MECELSLLVCCEVPQRASTCVKQASRAAGEVEGERDRRGGGASEARGDIKMPAPQSMAARAHVRGPAEGGKGKGRRKAWAHAAKVGAGSGLLLLLLLLLLLRRKKRRIEWYIDRVMLRSYEGPREGLWKRARGRAGERGRCSFTRPAPRGAARTACHRGC